MLATHLSIQHTVTQKFPNDFLRRPLFKFTAMLLHIHHISKTNHTPDESPEHISESTCTTLEIPA